MEYVAARISDALGPVASANQYTNPRHLRRNPSQRRGPIDRSHRLRGIVYQSDIVSWNRANTKRMAEGRERVKM
jgi:hypothetical protein